MFRLGRAKKLMLVTAIIFTFIYALIFQSHEFHQESGQEYEKTFKCSERSALTYKFRVNPINACKNSPDMSILTAIYSSPTHRYRREAVRRTWARRNLYRKIKMVTLFFIGMSKHQHINEAIAKEGSFYGDIVQQDFIDSYYNLSLKATSFLEWSFKYCPEAEFVLKTDDDVLVDTFGLAELMNYLIMVFPKTVQKIDMQDLIIGRRLLEPSIIRSNVSKYRASEEEYRGKYYPDYCSGAGYIIGKNLIPKLFNAAHCVPLFKFEDVWVTGILRAWIGAEILTVPHKYLFDEYYNGGYRIIDPIFTLMEELTPEWFDTWDDILKRKNK